MSVLTLLSTSKTMAAEPQAQVKSQVRGIDVSHFQGVVNWKQVAEQPLTFAIAKATGGQTYVDPQFHANWHSIRAVELTRGAYHFFYAADDPLKQAQLYLKTIGELKPFDLPPMLDVEIADHTAADKLLAGVLLWLETVEKATGRTPILYTDPAFGAQYLSDPRLAKYPLWIADYEDKVPPVPSPWKKTGWTFWQHSQTGKIQGVKGDVDLDVFFGNQTQFKQFIKGTKR